MEVQIQEIQSKTGRYYQIGGTIWSWVQLAPPDYLAVGWVLLRVPWNTKNNSILVIDIIIIIIIITIIMFENKIDTLKMQPPFCCML